MNKIVLVILVASLLVGCKIPGEHIQPVTEVQIYLLQQLDSLNHFNQQMRSSVAKRDLSLSQKNFKQSRYCYKKIESLVEFYFPGVAKALNGPAIDKPEEYDDKVIEASGFQVIEEQLFLTGEIDTTALVREIDMVGGTLTRLENLLVTNKLSDANIFEASRLEILRVISLGISGFDSPILLNSLEESFYALDGVRTILSFYSSGRMDDFNKTEKLFFSAMSYLRSNSDFDLFDRAAFISRYINPLTAELLGYQRAVNVKGNAGLAAINLEKEIFFEPDVFNMSFFAPSYYQGEKKQMIQLGKMLFFDPILSGNSRRSCASCHNPMYAFADNHDKSPGFNFETKTVRNAPTLVNSGFQRTQFWDQRVQFLEDQISDVMSNPTEMHGNMQQAAERLKKSNEYQAIFETAFNQKRESISPRNIQASLAWYIRSLQGLNARFDQYMRGDSTKMTGEELMGFNLFMGKAKCGTCHFLPLFNGTVPPMYQETESEVLGVPFVADTSNAAVDTDLGKYHTYHRLLHKHAFKTPTVRNAGITSPYMHNGVYKTLEEVIDFYNRGGGAGIGIDLPNQTLPFEKLNLTKTEQQQLISFIHALTDTTGLTTIPKVLPHINDPMLASRRVGGDY